MRKQYRSKEPGSKRGRCARALRLLGLCALGTLALGSEPALARPFRVVSYNVWGLPSPLLRHGERFEELPEAINALDADVVLIQEAFTSKAKALTRLPNFPYFAWGPRKKFLRFQSGLLILSKHPIEDVAKITFSRCGGVDCFSNKGALYARIRVPGAGPVSVFNTHLNANGHSEARVSQAAHLLRFVRSYSQGLPTVVGGDFNGDWRTIFAQAAKRPRRRSSFLLRDARAEFVEGNPATNAQVRAGYTADPVRNRYLDPKATQRKLDDIVLLDGSRPWKLLSYGLIFDGRDGKVLSDHFGVRLTADL